MLHLPIAVALAWSIVFAGAPGATPAPDHAATPAPHRAATPAPSRNAPADEYFGTFKISALRLRLKMDDLARRYDKRTESDDDLLHDAGELEAAMHVWLDQYPRDVWGPPTAFHLAQLYADIQTDAARADARAAFAYVAQHFGKTQYGRLSRLRLAQGFPQLRAEAPVVATPAPGSAAAVAGAPTPAPGSDVASPVAGASASSVPSPAPSAGGAAPLASASSSP